MPSSRVCTELGKQKGNMRRKAQHKLWTLILLMLLCLSGLAPGARIARAGTLPSDPVPTGPPSGPQAGDPDDPDSNKSLPKPGTSRGVAGPSSGIGMPRQSTMSMWMLQFRMAFASVYRFLFRF